MCRSQGLEVGEGTASTNSEPFCQIRSCTVASARASFSCSHSWRSRRSVCDCPPSGPGSERSIPALPASTNRSRQLPTVAEDTPCRRAASASDNSPFNTANTTWICSSTDTCRDGFCCLLTQPSFPTPQLNPLPESLTHSNANKAIVRRLVDAVFNGGHLEVIDELYAPALAPATKRWITPFRANFPDVHMELVELIAEGDKVVGRFTCSATHLGE
jgi:hypothetical protein